MYMNSKQCQVAASIIPKFKLNWTNLENREDIKQTLLEYVSEQVEQTKKNTSTLTSLTTVQNNSDSEDDFFTFKDNEINRESNDIQLIINNYLSNTNIKVPSDLPFILKKAFIQYNTAIPSSAHVERLFSAGGQVFNKRRGSLADKNFEMALLLKFNN